MRVIALVLMMTAASATARVRVDGNGVSAPGVRVDSSGVHTADTDVTSAGIGVGRGGGTTINTNGHTRTVDCGGGALTVNGNRNHLTVARCSRVTIAGNSNVAAVAFLRTGSRLFVPGNRNTVTWNAPRDVRVSTSAPGTRNTVRRN